MTNLLMTVEFISLPVSSSVTDQHVFVLEISAWPGETDTMARRVDAMSVYMLQ